MGFQEAIEPLRKIGFFDYYLPFILMFAIFYGLLKKSKIFGEDKSAEKINLIISLSASFYVTIFTPVGISLATFFANFFGGALIIFLTLLIFGGIIWMSFRISGKEKVELKEIKNLNVITALIGSAILIFIFSWAGGLSIFGVKGAQLAIDEVSVFIFIVIVLSLLGMWWMSKPEKEKSQKSESRE